MRTTHALLVCLAIAAPTALADSHLLPEGERTEAEAEPTVEELTEWHCEGWHRPAHCGNATLNASTGRITASWGLNGGSYAHPLPVSSAGDLTVRVGMEGEAGASANVTVAVGNAPGMLFTGSTGGAVTAFANAPPVELSFPFAIVPGWPEGDWLAPQLVLAAEGQRAVTWVPLVVAAAPPPPVDPTASIPLGWGLVAAASIALVAYVLGRRPWE